MTAQVCHPSQAAVSSEDRLQQTGTFTPHTSGQRQEKRALGWEGGAGKAKMNQRVRKGGDGGRRRQRQHEVLARDHDCPVQVGGWQRDAEWEWNAVTGSITQGSFGGELSTHVDSDHADMARVVRCRFLCKQFRSTRQHTPYTKKTETRHDTTASLMRDDNANPGQALVQERHAREAFESMLFSGLVQTTMRLEKQRENESCRQTQNVQVQNKLARL
ncbi:uncharacterized protein SPSK_10794 [Sporothrix schenckii 1099-18]|uniref:Uncharacterized protein n=1 Tax=Sporothrix schenckii 1099-18 TaxID=1397361 RepID=A0A0F2MH83_SPOSC|nr:uncharacterized protein SPSK_10794 [Sporothrix schenckii 1099-18]KJR88977.1 hypothetical protein SPSK_10794 [Sporothrix schenckii 1099-18]